MTNTGKSESMVDRVARELYALDPCEGQEVDLDLRPTGPVYQVAWEDLAEWDEGVRAHFMDMASAAINAMRDPSFEMMQAMYEAMFEGKFDGTQAPTFGAGWDAGIDAALKE